MKPDQRVPPTESLLHVPILSLRPKLVAGNHLALSSVRTLTSLNHTTSPGS